MEIALLAALILLNGIFAMSEIALVTARKSRLERMAEAGDKAAATAVKLGEDPTNFLSTIQIGITAIGILSGIFGEAALSVPLAATLTDFGLSVRTAGILATAIVVACITLFSIIIGELVPKRIGQSNAESVARLMARPIAVLSKIATPFVFLLSGLTNAILRLIGEKTLPTEDITQEDIHALIADGSEAGVIEKSEHEMLKNVFRLDDRQISTLMTPRSEAVFLDVDKPLEQSIQTLMNSNHSRFPVCRGGWGEVLGFTSAKRLLKRYLDPSRKGSPELDDILQPAVYVPETMSGMRLLEQFRDSGVKMVFVADEYGEVVGIVTIQNLLEALAGEFKPRDPEDLWAVQREDGSWLLDGLIPIPELKDRLGLKPVPEEHRGYYNTLGGMIMWLLDNMPRTGDACVWNNWRFEVVDLDGNRIDKVLASRMPEPAEAAGK
ncbi:MAG: hemolysin family protein [Planctomycetaceae bacterium]|nr:hemolysin family protein [Planctomycetaceae bacterium]